MDFYYDDFARRETEKRALKRTALASGLAIFIFFALSIFGTQFLEYFANLCKNGLGSFESREIVDQLFGMLEYLLPLLIAFLPFFPLTKIPFRVAVPFRHVSPPVFFSGVFVGLGTSVVGILLASFLLTGFQMLGLSYNVPEQSVPQSAVGILLYLVSTAVLPAFFEEIVFRGILMQSLRRFGDAFAIVTSAIVFVAFHGNFAQLPNPLLLGMMIGLFVVKTGSLWVGIAIHFANNFILTAVELLLPSDMPDFAHELVLLSVLLLYLVLAFIGFLILRARDFRLFTLYPSDSPLTSGQKCAAFFLQPVCLAALCLMFLFSFVFFL